MSLEKSKLKEIREFQKWQGTVPAHQYGSLREVSPPIRRRRRVIISPKTHVRIFDEHGMEHVFERAQPEEINTSMRFDWTHDKKKYAIGYAKAMFDEVKLVKMHPDDFLDISPMPTTSGFPYEPSMRSIKRGLDERSMFETPYILIDADNNVIGHEGRHRALALQRYGDKEMPVAIVFYP